VSESRAAAKAALTSRLKLLSHRQYYRTRGGPSATSSRPGARRLAGALPTRRLRDHPHGTYGRDAHPQSIQRSIESNGVTSFKIFHVSMATRLACPVRSKRDFLHDLRPRRATNFAPLVFVMRRIKEAREQCSSRRNQEGRL